MVCRGLPWLVPYQGQPALDGLQFSPVIVDRDGVELQVLPLKGGLRRVFRPLAQLPPDLVRIVLAAEDRRFWLHPGVDPWALVRAWLQNTQAGETVSGASTVSMQLARLLVPRPRTAVSKLIEAWEALQLEARLGKDGVLELYLNLVPFGRNAEGFPAAARVFYGHDLADLTPAALASLAVVPRSPRAYDPFDRAAAHAAARARLAAGFGPADLPGEVPPALDPGRAGIWPFRTPHYVRWLTQRPGVFGDGRAPVATAIEPRLQGFLENLVARSVAEARSRRITNAAAYFLRPETMEVAAWVGSSDFGAEADQGQIDGVTMLRQPGSTLKPFLYALALEGGLTASTVLPDVPTDFGGAEVYTPANFNDQFNGPVRLRQALASSLNVPAVHTLQRIGVRPFTEFLIRAGFHSLEGQQGRLGLGLALGNAEVSLKELVEGYGLFLHRGTPKPGVPGLLDPRVADLVRDILTRHPDRVLAFGRAGNTRLSFEGALKTGTSNQFNNLWAVGFTPELLGGVWMGDFSGRTAIGTADSGFPAAIVARTLEAFGSGRLFPPVRDLERHPVCSLSGLAAGPFCDHVFDEWFLPGTAPKGCDWHGADGVSFPQEYRSWLAKYRYRQGGFLEGPVQILRPRDGAVFFLDPTLPAAGQQLAVEATGNGRAEVLVDGRIVGTGRFPLRIWVSLAPGTHRLTVRGSEEAGEESIRYEVR